MSASTLLLLPLAGEGGPAERGRMRDVAVSPAYGASGDAHNPTRRRRTIFSRKREGEREVFAMTLRRSDTKLRRARSMRGEPTKAEELLWKCLRDRRIDAKFRRQVPIGPYIVDFASLAAKLVVELDGPPHDKPEQQASDVRRDAWFAMHGWRVLRIPNEVVFVGGDIALNRIKAALPKVPSSDPTSSGHLLPQAGEGQTEGDR